LRPRLARLGKINEARCEGKEGEGEKEERGRGGRRGRKKGGGREKKRKRREGEGKKKEEDEARCGHSASRPLHTCTFRVLPAGWLR